MLRHGKAPVERHQHGSEPGTGKQQNKEERAVVSQMRDAVAGADAELGERARHLAHLAVERGPGQAAPCKMDRHILGSAAGVALEPGGKVHRRRPTAQSSFSPGS